MFILIFSSYGAGRGEKLKDKNKGDFYSLSGLCPTPPKKNTFSYGSAHFRNFFKKYKYPAFPRKNFKSLFSYFPEFSKKKSVIRNCKNTRKEDLVFCTSNFFWIQISSS